MNQELMQAIKFAKENPLIIQQINKNAKISDESKDVIKKMKNTESKAK